MEGIGICCAIINKPSKISQKKSMWKWGRIDFCCGQSLMMVRVALAYLPVELFF